MLSWDEEDYLSKIPEDKRVEIIPFDPRITEISEELIGRVHIAVPDLEVRHMGASSLGLSGQNDIDVYIFCKEENYAKYLPKIEKVFGPKIPGISSVKWSMNIEGFEIEMYLTDPSSPTMKRQIAVFEALKKNGKLREEYEKLKESLNGTSFKEYQRNKYEFYHRILDN
jgi:GrpB-like predicted nucleotidyltransferase (UPF0157 family)